MHLDTVCTMVDVDKIVMYPNVADSLRAYAVTHTGDGPDGDLVLDVAAPEPFLVAAAKAMGIDTLHQIDTGLDPVTAEREQWDDGNNTLALAPRVAVAYERNIETNARLEEAGDRGGRDRRLASSARAAAGPAACRARSAATNCRESADSGPICRERDDFGGGLQFSLRMRCPAAVDGGCNNGRAPTNVRGPARGSQLPGRTTPRGLGGCRSADRQERLT